MDRHMRIAQVAPLVEACPPKGYGGTERIVWLLTEELVKQGHQVTLFATGDSHTSAELHAVAPRGLRSDPACSDYTPYQVLLLDEVARRAADFDLVHFHLELLHFPMAARLGPVTVTTQHGTLDRPELTEAFRRFAHLPHVSISDSQRQAMPWMSWMATVHHGLDPASYPSSTEVGKHAVFIGRMSAEKGPHRAVRIAAKAGMPLCMAAKCDPTERPFFEQVVLPLLRRTGAEYVGEVTEAHKLDLMAGAVALLFPIRWPEPFGLTMIESMLCGTPVVAFRHGSVPEVVDEGVTGFIVDDEDEAAEALLRAADLDRAKVRSVAERRFSASRMADDYVVVYEQLLQGSLSSDVRAGSTQSAVGPQGTGWPDPSA